MPILSPAPPHSTDDLQGAILRSVSRSFYLSIRLLPAPLRDPIALGYLLARATDTIADTTDVGAALRMHRLGELAALIQGAANPELAAVIRDSVAPLQKDPSERALMQALPEAIAWLRGIAPADRADIQRVLTPINKGQALDVERFANPQQIVALQTAAELDEYTYLVAGCVGEFWTNVCIRKLPHFADRPRDEMVSLGVRYGKGLQLINILRDIGGDLRAGRCYLPAEQLASVGVSADQIIQQSVAVEPLLRAWQETAGEGLQAGIDYACAIRPWRLRLATALPALIGARTLVLLRRAGARAIEQRIKVSRAEVRRILLTTIASLASRRVLAKQFRRPSADA